MAKSKAPSQTFQEPAYLRHLSHDAVPVRVKLVNNEEYEGVIEYWDARFIRLTRTGGPNLFIFKHEIKYVSEIGH